MSGLRLRARWLALLALPFLSITGTPAATPEATAAPAPETAADIQDLVRLWSGVHDTAVQVILDDRSVGFAATDASRLRTVVAPVELQWLGPTVLYLEETLHDVPGAPRRQVLLRLSVDSQLRPRRVRVRQYTIRNPQQWRGLFTDAQAQQALRRTDLATLPGCDILMMRDGDEFHGGTLGRGCVAPPVHPQRYVDYALQVGPGVYWFRTRQYRFSDDALVQESAGYDWPVLHLAQLYSCRVRWAPGGQATDLVPLLSVTLADQGGHADITLPDGRPFRLTLHRDDWPFDASNRALLLILEERAPHGASARGWNATDSLEVGVSMQVIDARCAPIASPGNPPLAAASH